MKEIKFAIRFLSTVDKYDYDTDYFRQSLKTALAALRTMEWVENLSYGDSQLLNKAVIQNAFNGFQKEGAK